MADDKTQDSPRQADRKAEADRKADDALGRETGVHAVPGDDKSVLKSLLANEATKVDVVADRGDPIHGEHEAQPGEMLPFEDLNAKANRQRYEAQKDEPLEYPGDSGLQAKAHLDAHNKSK